ncbi:MAG: hypothetical protein CM1200mP15_08070 [Dehalococcoidia bacterium]|nr:MAG: hypothetical protein CM1200mP15_08070 [Dehalococcoidia bacterium]
MGVGMEKDSITRKMMLRNVREPLRDGLGTSVPRYPYGDYCWDFEYRTDDHDHGEKSFLGETGRFNGTNS